MNRENIEDKRGAAFIEIAISVGILFLIFNGIWLLHSKMEAERAIYGAVLSMFSRERVYLFNRDEGGDKIPWDDSTVGSGLVDSLTSTLEQDISAAISTIGGSGLSCNISICYPNVELSGVNAGKVKSSPDPSSYCTPSLSAALEPVSSMSAEALQYHQRLVSMDAKVNIEEARYILDPDKPDQTAPTEIYLPYAPFFVWGCKVDIGSLLWSEELVSVGIYVPRREE